jgi:hypothetical protein
LEKTILQKAKDPTFPSDAKLIWYEVNGETHMDLCRGKNVRIFDMYYDKYGPGTVKKIDFGYGRTNPIVPETIEEPASRATPRPLDPQGIPFLTTYDVAPHLGISHVPNFKEAAYREQQEALTIAKKLMEENKTLKAKVYSGQEVFANAAKEAADGELALAKRDYREAYESGDADKIIEAQERMTSAKLKAEQIKFYKSDNEALQNQENDVQLAQEQPKYVPDLKAKAWQERNSWFGQDEEMTSLALGLHEKLVKENGMSYATTNEYYDTIDKTMRRRFPENFEESEVREDEPQKTNRPKASTVVAPATRSTSPKKIRLSGTQVQLAKKLGLTPEQYARELTKLEAQNG